MTSENAGVLGRVNSPADLKSLSAPERETLARELRDAIIGAMSRNGGHLASNLGTVELTIALHTAWEAPRDIIIFDTGHQAYPHKLLTGRRDRFDTIRQGGGLSGFLRREESEFDPFGAGHAGTSISAALGFAKSRDLRGTDERVVAVIGDSALTSGMAVEALNNAGQLHTNVTVILNDNSMAIARSVGALSYHLARLRTRPFVQDLEQRAKDVLEHIKVGKKQLHQAADGLKLGMAHFVSPKDGPLFEQLGFSYYGPIDGHDTEAMIEIFRAVRDMKGPVLVHVVTVKGKGCQFAEDDARCFHGVTPFDPECGEFEAKPGGNPSWTGVFSAVIEELAEQDPRVTAITAAMPDGTGLKGFSEKFPERFFDVAIAEQHAVTFAAGLAAGGYRPVVAIYSTFMQRAYDQILHDVCIQGLPVTLCLDRAGFVGDDGPTHHGIFDLSFLRMMPGLVIMAPSTPQELADMMLTAIRHDGPAAIRYPRGSCPEPWERRAPAELPVGRGLTVRAGDDIAIVAIGPAVKLAWDAAALLDEQGISAEVINARFVKPLDESLIVEAAQRCGRMIVLEENALIGGFGSAVLEVLSEKAPECRVARFGAPDRFVEHNKPEVQLEECGLTPADIAARASAMCAARAVAAAK